MSTTYYKPVPPITSLAVDVNGMHTHLSIWVNHVNAGSLTLRNEEASGVLSLFRGIPLFFSYFGGDKRERVIELRGNPTDSLVVISETGEIVKVKDLLKLIEKEEEEK